MQQDIKNLKFENTKRCAFLNLDELLDNSSTLNATNGVARATSNYLRNITRNV